MKKTLFIKNAAVLTVTGFVLRLLGIVFKIWLTRTIGQAGIGLYQIVFSFYVLVSTFATTGICTAVTRICGDEINSGAKSGIRKILRFSAAVTIGLAALTTVILYFCADMISKSILSDMRASISLKIMGFSLPFLGICSCLRGYFIARRKATPPAISQIFEQIVRIAAIILGIKIAGTHKADIVCGIIMLGDVAAEGFSCGFLGIVYKKDLKKIKSISSKTISTSKIAEKTADIALPITGGRYLNSLLRTLENILVPKKLVQSGSSRQSALAQFGMIKGSALPILFFPSTLLNSISTLLLPELSIEDGKKHRFAVKATVEEVIITTSLVSYIISALFFFYGRELGVLFYNNLTVGWLIRILSPIVPLMYLDSICDGMLKGLNMQNFTFFTGVTDSSARIILIMLIVPRYGILGFVLIMYFSNAFTGFLNLWKLIKTSSAAISFRKYVFLPICCAVIISGTTDTVLRALPITNILVYIIFESIISCVVYGFAISKISGRQIIYLFK